MKGKAKTPKTPGILRDVVADNIQALMNVNYRGSENKPLDLANDAGISLSSVQRILNKSVGASVDTLERISIALGVSVYQLLIPNLNPRNPQVVKGATKEEERMYRRLPTIDHRTKV